MSQRSARSWMVGLFIAALALPAAAAEERRVNVANDAALRAALKDAKAGTRIVIAPGKYQGGIYAGALAGTADAPIVIEGADAKNKPVFEGGRIGPMFSACAHLTLRNLVVRGQPGGGINVDDGGELDKPAHHITLEGLDVSGIGPTGNVDAIKLSGIDDLRVRGCATEGWGGEGIDMVGCHRVLIEGCVLRGKEGFAQETGIQVKGGSSEVVIRNCTFVNVGKRGVNAGGSTSLNVFRPRNAKYEAKDVTVEGCRFVGGLTPIAFVGIDGGAFRYNTVYHPARWVMRILQETTEPGFVASRGGRFERNIVVYKRAQVFEPINIGLPGTDPESFTFADNFWYCDDRPNIGKPKLPTPEKGGVVGTDPGVTVGTDGTVSAPSAGAAKEYGADALPKAGK